MGQLAQNDANSVVFPAQSATICSQPTATINSQADASAYADCSTISGSVVIGSAASGDLSLNGPSSIGGDLVMINATAGHILLQFYNWPDQGNLPLGGLDPAIIFELRVVDRSQVHRIHLSAQPRRPHILVICVERTDRSISNTFLGTLNGINLNTVATLQINNNPHLVSFSTQVGNITSAAVFNANGAGLKIDFPNLIWAANLTFRDVASVNIPSLAVVNGSLGFYETSLNSIYAPNLTSVGSFATGQGSLAFVANTALTNISMDALKSVGGADQIANNTILGAISFPALVDVGGAIDFSGNFTT